MLLLRYSLAVLILSVLVCGRCEGSSKGELASVAVEASPSSSRGVGRQPVRLCQERHQEARQAVRAPLPVRPDASWVGTGVGEGALRENGIFFMEKGSNRPCLQFRASVQTRDYNLLRVTMRVDAGSTCRLNWHSDLEPNFAVNPGQGVAILADNEFHSYVLPLHGPGAQTWAGHADEFKLFPSEVPANVEIKSLEFAYTPPPAPLRITVAGETREALAGAQAAWPVAIPPKAAFEVHLAMDPRSWKVLDTDGVRFTCTLDSAEGGKTVLADQTLTPETDETHRNWVPVQVDLGAFEGQEVVLRLDVHPLSTTCGDYAYWGNPIVYPAGQLGDSIPVVLISCDTLRADHLSCYGYERETSPYLDRFVDEAVVFENAVVQDAWTLPSHVTMLTGLYPKNHRVTPGANLAETLITLPEVLRSWGYLTAGFTSVSWWLEPWRGLSHGFDVYSTPLPYRSIFRTHNEVRNWLNGHPGDRIFLLIHNYDIHSKSRKLDYKLAYVPEDREFRHFSKALDPAPSFEREGMEPLLASDFLMAANRKRLTMTQEEAAYITALYDDCILQTDYAIHQLLDNLKERGLYDQALIIITADHGEAFGEHGLFMHEQAYEHCARVPLIIKFPRGRFAGRRIEHVVQSTDLFPTVVDVLGFETDVSTDGQSLLAILENRREPREWAYTRRHSVDVVRTNRWKLFEDAADGHQELYDLADDPTEKNNLVSHSPPELVRAEDELNLFYTPNPGGWHFLFRGGKTKAKLTINLTTDDQFESVAFVPPRRAPLRVTKDGRALKGDLRVDVSGTQELIVRTFSPKARVSVSMRSEVAFLAVAGSQEPTKTNDFTVLLDPVEQIGLTRPSIENPLALAVSTWYVAPSAESTAAKELTDKERDELGALGYFE